MSLPLPKAPLERCLRTFIAQQLPVLRSTPIPPCRHADVTLLIYWFPKADAQGVRPTEPCEFALRQSLTVLGQLPTVIVTDHAWQGLTVLAERLGATVQEEATLVPGDIWSMSIDCIARLATRFHTRHVLIVQHDGWPLRDALHDFLRYDYVGAPDVRKGWRSTVADALALTVLNGGFSLRSKRLCTAVAHRWHLWKWFLKPGNKHLSEDIFYTRTLRLWDPVYRFRYRFPSSTIARQFSVECLDGAQPVPLQANPMGFHGRVTAQAFIPSATPLTVVSVVRDWALYDRCVRHNPYLAGARFVALDNTQENVSIPKRFNDFLASLPDDTGWILFAHEDFELLEDPRPLLNRQNPLFLYGHIGTRRWMGMAVIPAGAINDSHRDGSDPQHLAPPKLIQWLAGGLVEAFDCCGFYVHTDAFKTWKLRFDEACAWDLYAEDLCFQAIRTSGHLARILPVRAHHWSRGNPLRESFIQTKAYLDEKYADAFFAGGTCTFVIGQRPPLRFRLYRWLVRLLFLRRDR